VSIVTLSNGRSFVADSHVSILDAALGHGIVLEYSCRTGRCGTCLATVISGRTASLRDEECLSGADKEAGRILTCCRAAEDDVELDIADLPRLAGIAIKTVPCRIADVVVLAPDVLGVTLRLPPASPLQFVPGQYVEVIAKGVRRSYSLANAPRPDGMLELHIRNYPGGVLSRFWFEEAKTGDLLRLQAPLGTFFFRDLAAGPILFLATGTGIAPVKSILDEFAARPELTGGRDIHVYWGNRQQRDVYWTPQYADLPVRFVPVLSRPGEGWTGRRSYVQDAALADLRRFEHAEVYACGSQSMIEAAKSLLVANGLPPRHFFSDAFVTST
jgi:CDP-4-dehydro-6-deoxyglucose reductase